MVDDWRQKWTQGTQGQTDHQFPFGFVQLNSIGNKTVYNQPTDTTNGDPYNPQFGYAGLRWSQTAGYGYVPNAKMPRVFMATSFDTPDRPYPVPFNQGKSVDQGFNVHSPFKQQPAARLARSALEVAYSVQVDTTGPLVESVKRAAGGIVITIKNLGAGSGVELHSTTGFEVLTADSKWTSVPIQTHTNDTVTVGDVKGATKLRYSWYSNPCGEDCFGCAVYIAAKPLVAGLSGEEPFPPLPPFSASFQ